VWSRGVRLREGEYRDLRGAGPNNLDQQLGRRYSKRARRDDRRPGIQCGEDAGRVEDTDTDLTPLPHHRHVHHVAVDLVYCGVEFLLRWGGGVGVWVWWWWGFVVGCFCVVVGCCWFCVFFFCLLFFLFFCFFFLFCFFFFFFFLTLQQAVCPFFYR